ncbi:MAG: hypothetical protein AAGC60_04870 [Acidobacteriota bacterium]
MNELDTYLADTFRLDAWPPVSRSRREDGFPLADEPFVDCWSAWAAEAETAGAFEVLRRYLPQFSFPIAAGMSRTEAYRRATLQGVAPEDLAEATGLDLERPDSVRLIVHPSLAGRIPILEITHRPTFVQLCRALAKRNEPAPIAAAVGAQMVAGYNNWSRIAEHRRAFLEQPPEERRHATWAEAFADLRTRKSLYQDQFILLSAGPYSDVPARDLGLEHDEWSALSLTIRREHECTHYFTRRVFGAIRNHLLDELLCDYAGIVAARGCFRADWLHRFLGLDEFPRVRPDGRVHSYRGEPPLSEASFERLVALVHAAAVQLERFDRSLPAGPRRPRRRALHLAALATQRLDHLAADDGAETLARAVDALEAKLRA